MAMEQLTPPQGSYDSPERTSFQRRSLLISKSIIKVPWVMVEIGEYTFGVNLPPEALAFGWSGSVQQNYNYITQLTVAKINGQVNKYTLDFAYPVTIEDDPNFFEKVFSSVSGTREIVFTYGDLAAPNYIYKNEKAIITDIDQRFTFDKGSSVITYQVTAVSSASIKTDGCRTFPAPNMMVKPSDEIKKLILTDTSLKNVFTGMTGVPLEDFIAGDDQPVKLQTKVNTSVLDYISYLVSCMIPIGTTPGLSKDIYILTIHDETIYDGEMKDNVLGPHFKVTKTSYVKENSGAYVINIGMDDQNLVKNFQIMKNQNYSLYYDYQAYLHPNKYAKRLDDYGNLVDVYAPAELTTKASFDADSADMVWWTKTTKFPITAQLTVQGLLRPAQLMSYVRLNVIFPGGKKHISSGLYIITSQIDRINASEYTTMLSLTRVNGDDEGPLVINKDN